MEEDICVFQHLLSFQVDRDKYLINRNQFPAELQQAAAVQVQHHVRKLHLSITARNLCCHHSHFTACDYVKSIIPLTCIMRDFGAVCISADRWMCFAQLADRFSTEMIRKRPTGVFIVPGCFFFFFYQGSLMIFSRDDLGFAQQ